MYTGTLITELMATVQQAERTVRQHKVAFDEELHEIFAMQIPIIDGDQLLMGAA
jgi:TPP-dependent indolepyruvate ferredoxin oxidoreductase alpha subunit